MSGSANTFALYTIGYASHTLDSFAELLFKHKIDVVADVRSSPYSQFKAEFNREGLSAYLKKIGISYLFFGDLWGARIEDRSCYVEGKVDFDLAATTKNFQEGMDRVKKGVALHRIALMCAEKDPLTCHRSILLSRNVVGAGIKVQHILSDGLLEEHRESELRLLKIHKLHHPHLFLAEQQRIERAYILQADKVAYSEADRSGEHDNDNDHGSDWLL